MFFFNWAEFFLLSSSCLSSAPLVFHHQSSHITTLLVNIFAYNHRHRRLIKYIISASQLTQICRWDLWIPRRRSKDSKPFARFTKYIPDKLDKWLQIYDEKVRDFIKTRIMIHERMNIQTKQKTEDSIAIIWFCSMFPSAPSPIIVYPHQWWLTPPLLLLRLEWCDSVWWW